MGRIETLSNFGGQDHLEGAPVKDREVLRVTWPDGTQEELQVHLQVTQGADWQDSLAFAQMDYRGQPFLVKLSGLEAVRIACSCSDGSCAFCEDRFAALARRRADKKAAQRAEVLGSLPENPSCLVPTPEEAAWVERTLAKKPRARRKK